MITVDGPAASGKGTIASRLGAAYALPVLRHRLFRNFAAVSDGISTDMIVEHVLKHVAEPDYR